MYIGAFHMKGIHKVLDGMCHFLLRFLFNLSCMKAWHTISVVNKGHCFDSTNTLATLLINVKGAAYPHCLHWIMHTIHCHLEYSNLEWIGSDICILPMLQLQETIAFDPHWVGKCWVAGLKGLDMNDWNAKLEFKGLVGIKYWWKASDRAMH